MRDIYDELEMNYSDKKVLIYKDGNVIKQINQIYQSDDTDNKLQEFIQTATKSGN
eukprot:UN01647